MKDILRQLIIDFHSESFPEFIHRDVDIPSFPSQIRKATVFVGMRRTGKTWVMHQHMHDLIASGLPLENLLYLNFEDDRLISFTHQHFQCILDTYFELYPALADSSEVHFFFDEIHQIEGWEKFIRRLLDKHHVALYLSGSSSKMLSKEIATSLRGRTISIEIFPYGFSEFLRSHQVTISQRMPTTKRNKVINLFHDYLVYGGFPERLNVGKNLFHTLLQGYLDVVIYRDIVERYKVSDAHLVRELLAYCIQNCSSLTSVLNIYHRFKSLGRSVGKNTLYEYMSYFEDAYCLFSVPLFTLSHTKQLQNPKKLYAVDQGLITACSMKPRFEETMRLENAVFSALRRSTENIYYYKTRTGKEVDFITTGANREVCLTQVCLTLQEPSTRKRELSGLYEAMEELEIKHGTILTLEESETVTQGKATITIKPLWKWLLEIPRG